ncbi:MAG: sugar phosphate nucleotidyltransferase [Thaumarchaeota archaeon]|nr:sugar phosphate nucleotidyltransferase [Nitrososphaerota archaeon]
MTDLKGMSAVITAGGLGTRLLPYSKEIPKEMAPIIVSDQNNTVLVKPVIQAIFEQLFDSGIRNVFTVVGRGKRAIEDHFTPDQGFIELLKSKGKGADGLASFYDKLKKSDLVFVMQPEPLGFGDAVLRIKPYVKERFLVHAGDTYIISENNDYLSRLLEAHTKNRAEATILLQQVVDTSQFGVVTGIDLFDGVIEIKRAIEKPKNFISNIAIMPVYIFNESIFAALESIAPGSGGELQLTDAIQLLVESGKKVLGVKLRDNEIRLDIGSPETLMEALRTSSKYVEKGNSS